MCRIAAIFAYHYASLEVNREELRSIRDATSNRGPDGAGEWYSSDGRVGLGHRRPAVTDFSKTLVISFDGEISNYKELKTDLEIKGRVFKSQSDTEVLLHLYEEKGEAMLSDLKGTFAWVLWDGKRKKMLLACDPSGIKPLYYTDDGWTVRAASQVKALEARAFCQEICQVPAGSYVWVSELGSSQPTPFLRGKREKAKSFTPPTKTKVLALVTDAFGSQYGIAKFNQWFLSALTSDNKTSIVILTRAGKRDREVLTSRIRWRGMHKTKLGYALSAFKAVLTEKPDFIFCGHVNLAPLVAFLSILTGVPFWLQLYGVDAWENRSILHRWAVRRAQLIFSISRYTRQRFLAWSGVPSHKVRILPCVIENRFEPGPKPAYLLERYGLVGKKVLLTVARLSSRDQYKGHDLILHVLPRLLERHPDLVYVIAGEGDDQSRLEKLAQEKKLNGAVRFIGRVEESELVDIYRMADLFAMPSKGEGFGIAFLEAARSGIPVIGGKADGSVDALREGKIGKMVDPDNSEELIRMIEESLNATPRRQIETEYFSSSNFTRQVRLLAREAIDKTL